MGNIELLEDACAKLPHTTRRMFGGHGLFAPNGGMFAGIVTDDEIILKLAEPATRAQLEALGGHAWVYDGKMTMKEWIVVPERFYDEPETLASWAKRAHALAPAKVVKAKPVKGKERTPAKKAPPAKASRKPARKRART